MIGGRVLDPAAILDTATGASVYGAATLDVALRLGVVIAVPTAALTTVWAHAPTSARPFLDMLLGLPVVVVDDLDAAAAAGTGVLAARADDAVAELGTVGSEHIGQAHAIHVSRSRGGWPVITGNREGLLAIDPRVPFESLP